MSLQEQIEKDVIDALKRQDSTRLSVLRLLKNALKNASIAQGGTLTDDAALAVLKKQAKDRQESIALYTTHQKPDAARKEQAELAIIETYLPAELPDKELFPAILKIMDRVKPTGIGDFGKVMGAVMAEFKGKADAQKISDFIKKQLS